MFSDQILAANPYGVLLAIVTASLGVLKLRTDKTGPKISTCAMKEDGDTLVNIEGG